MSWRIDWTEDSEHWHERWFGRINEARDYGNDLWRKAGMLAIPLTPFGGKAWHRWRDGGLIAKVRPNHPRLAPSARLTAEVKRTAREGTKNGNRRRERTRKHQ